MMTNSESRTNGTLVVTAGAGVSAATQDDTMNATWTSDSSNSYAYTFQKVESRYYYPNVWKATLTTEPKQVFFDETKGTKVGSIVLCDGANDWYWAGNILYIYYTEDPDEAVEIEASVLDHGIYNNDKSYITYDGLHIKFTNGRKKYG